MIPTSLPNVTLLIAAYNEADILMEKVRNCYALNYPADQLDIVFVTDGSTDGSNEMLQDLPLIRVFHHPQRGGKLAAVNRAMQKVKNEIVVLTDANCMLNREALQNIVRHYEDPSVGAVAGEKRVLATGNSAGQGEGIYWKYESFLKKLDSELYSVVGAAGELFSFRRSLFRPLEAGTIIEDFVLSMEIATQGHRVVYEPDATASEAPSANMREEWKRKVRICAGGFQAIQRFAFLLNPVKFSVVAFQFISHRMLRWAIVPFALPVILLLTALLAQGGSMFYLLFFVAQLGFYGMASLGLLYLNQSRVPRLISIPFQFVMMNAAAYAGLWKYLRGSQSAVWDKSVRHA
ncbi:MAG: glycosyltransferase family 2 protein [Cyclobacteriaceae bacterium]